LGLSPIESSSRLGDTFSVAATVVHTTELLSPIAHFSHAVRYGQYVLVGGKGATDPRSTVSSAGHGVDAAAAQAERMFGNVATVLRLLEIRPADALQMRVYLTDWRYRPAFDAACQQAFGDHPPAMTVVQSISFAIPDLLLEIDLIAADGGQAKQVVSLADGRRAGLRFGSFLYTEGLLGTLARADGAVADTSVQTETALQTLLATLEQAGLGSRHLARVGLTVADPRDVPAALEVWRQLLPAPRPPCLLVCAGLPDPRARVQVEGIAAAGGVELVDYGDLGSSDPELAGESAAARAGDLVFTASLPFGSFGALPASRDAEAATDRALDALFATLQPFGCGPADLLRVGAALPDWRWYRGFNVAYSQRIPPPYPARSAIEALPAGLHQAIELDAIAGLQASQRSRILAPPEFAPPLPRQG
jgi:enamine deaminase RidA (YjgF/YER057c/UK114 family)